MGRPRHYDKLQPNRSVKLVGNYKKRFSRAESPITLTKTERLRMTRILWQRKAKLVNKHLKKEMRAEYLKALKEGYETT